MYFQFHSKTNLILGVFSSTANIIRPHLWGNLGKEPERGGGRRARILPHLHIQSEGTALELIPTLSGPGRQVRFSYETHLNSELN